ncbi:23S rRNA (pseudouridine1915-N3)-methyltransferase [Palleronia aestuarii]|uniref:Ribosomal RNA large subunit methyltransferase H n=1 Tax=Palleronia aestuarii TaxID=568105 RepID=A0A2W7NG63_9RHOB|nr:23S rRNA (pseudouridine(1915)-N(3))-methyltransferase RlmH [Palleronia aestuarii]PZX18890.1 23S rRNA (pseudouridine1915-N3)-methyltransferase [Palleronia aestuarii]
MRVRLCTVGRLRSGPERDLVTDYLARFDRAGRALSLGPAEEIEVDPRRAQGMAAEGDALLRHLGPGGMVCALDERGSALTSPKFADKLVAWRDAGHSDLAFVIGGADGLAPAIRERADASISLGRMVWPHMLVRVMLAEQLYRAVSILSGHPYHRE